MNIIKIPTKRLLPARSSKPVAVVVHTTGDTDLNKIIKFYQSADGFQPHYMIDKTGVIRQFVEEDKVAYHAKIGYNEATLYKKGWSYWSKCLKTGEDTFKQLDSQFTGYTTWRYRWPSLESPLKLVTGSHPNFVAIGIELQQPMPVEITKDIFLDPQYASLKELLTDINKRTGILLDADHVLGHSDCSPMTRSTSKGGWDPGVNFNWSKVLG